MDYNCYKLDFKKFNLSEDQFDQRSNIHGILHTYRVMLHCLRLGLLSGLLEEAKIAFFGAYIHDMARLHDGYCTIHGADSARNKFPTYIKLFLSEGAGEPDLEIIRQIVIRHSVYKEPVSDHKLYKPLALLKDADALDRIRLGRNDLNPEFLRHKVTLNSIEFGEDLYFATDGKSITSFSQLMLIANDIDQNVE